RPGDLPLPALKVPTKVNDFTWSDLAIWGGTSYCGVTKAKHLYCWGDNSRGQLGRGDTTYQAAPARVAGSGWTEITSGGTLHTPYFCGLESDPNAPDRRYCWGGGDFGNLGLKSTKDRNKPGRRGDEPWA